MPARGLKDALQGPLGRRVRLVDAALTFVPQREGGAPFHEVADLLAGHGCGFRNRYNPIRADNGQLRSAHALSVAPEVCGRAPDRRPQCSLRPISAMALSVMVC